MEGSAHVCLVRIWLCEIQKLIMYVTAFMVCAWSKALDSFRSEVHRYLSASQ